MSNQQEYFNNLSELHTHLQEQQFILVDYRLCEGYEGMVVCIMLRFNRKNFKYELDLEWECLGADLYGDTLQESYVYQFESLETLLDYLFAKYRVQLTGIPVKYSFDHTQFPNPIKDSEKKPVFEAAWQRFREDFKKDAFLDPSLKLIYSSL